MKEKWKAQDVMQILVKLLHNKEKIVQVLGHMDADEIEAGVLGFHQDLLNKTFKMEIMDRAPIENYEVEFMDDTIVLTVDKFIKVLMLEKVLKLKLTFMEPEFAFSGPSHYFFAKYNLDIDGIPPILEKMPGGSSIKESVVSTLLKSGIRDLPWIQVVGDRIYVDFTKVEGFDKLRDEGFYGIDLINTLELGNLQSKKGRLMLTYNWGDMT